MANGNADVELVFGVSGGGKLSGDSGKSIKQSLEELVRELENKGIPKFKIFFDEKDFKVKVSNLKKLLKSELGDSLTINIKNSQTETTKENKGTSTKSVSEETKLYKDLEKELKETYKAKKDINKVKVDNSNVEETISKLNTENEKLSASYDKVEQAQRQGALAAEQYAELMKMQAQDSSTVHEKLTNAQVAYGKLTDKVRNYITRTRESVGGNKQVKEALRQIEDELSKVIFTEDELLKLSPEEKAKRIQAATNDLLSVYSKQSTELAKLGLTAETVGQKFTNAFKNKFMSILSAGVIGFASRALRQVYQNVVSIDSAITQLRIVTRATASSLTKYFDDTAKAAKKLGIQIDSLIESTTTFARLGFSLNDSSVFAKLTAQYSNVTGVSVSDATTNLTAIIKAYNITADEAESVLDKMIIVGNNYAISSGELGEAMNNAASILASNGNTLEQAMGLLAAANTTLQDVSKSSTAIRTITARISASTAVLEELGEGTENLLATADLDKKMGAFGVSITDANGELRSTYDILNDLAKGWSDFTSVQQAAIAEMIAGTRQQTAFYSIMTNWQDAVGAVQDCDTALGMLNESYDVYLDSIEGKLGQLTAAWQSFSENILDSAIVKFFVDILKVIANFLDWLTSIGDGAMGTAVMSVAAITLMSVAWATFKNKFAGYGAEIIQTIKSIGTSWNTYATIIITLLLTLSQSSDQTIQIITLVIIALGALGVAVSLFFKKANKAVWNFMKSNPIGWILLAITAVVVGIQALFKLLAGESYSSLKDAAKDAQEAWSDLKETISSINDELGKLRENIDALESKDNKTAVELKELAELKRQEALLQQELLNTQDLAKQAEKEAAEKTMKAINKYNQEKDGWWIFKSGDELSTKVDKYLADWEATTESQRKVVTNYLAEVKGLTEKFTYYTGDNLESWQIEMNKYLDDYYDNLDRYTLSLGNVSATWNSVISREKFSGAIEALTDLANSFTLSKESFEQLIDTNSSVKEFVEYLERLGLYASGDAESLDALLYQIKEFATTAVTVTANDYISIYDSLSNTFDALSEALEDMGDTGILSGDTMTDLLEQFPTIMEYLESIGDLVKTDDGYTLSVSTVDDWLDSVRKSYQEAEAHAQEYYDKIAELAGGNEVYKEELAAADKSLQNAKKNRGELEIVINTLEKSALISEFTEKMKNQSDALDAQLDKNKNLLDIRKELLESYKEEVDYLKELATKQKTVATLQTQLALARLDTSAAGQARAREIESKLTDAQEELDDFTLEHAIDTLIAEMEIEGDEYENFIKTQTELLTAAINNAASMTVTGLKEALGYEDKSTSVDGNRSNNEGNQYHAGGFVGGYATLKSNEQFAKLLTGEFVSTPTQMHKFMNHTLPSIVQRGNLSPRETEINYNSPLVVIQCDTITKDSLPKVNEIVNQAVEKVKEEINSAFSRTGKKSNINKFRFTGA